MRDDPGLDTAIAVVEEDAILLSQIVRALDSVAYVRPFNTLEEVLEARPGGLHQLILVLGPSQATESVLEQAGSLARLEPGTGALLVIAAPDTFTLRTALRAGLDDAVPLERIGDDLVPAIAELDRRLRAATAEIREATQNASHGARGHITAVFSPKGGVGRSVVAVNLAAAFAARTQRRVVLVDADPQFGDVSVMLRLSPVHTLLDAVAAGERLDPTLLDSLLTRDERSGVDVLAAPTDPTSPTNLNPKSLSAVLDVLREMGALVVVDTPRSLDDNVLQILGEADDMVYIVGMDVPSVKNARLGLQALELVQIPLARVLLVLNQADNRVQLSVRDVEKVLQMKLDVSLPEDAAVPKSVNRGAPAVLAFERSRFAASIYETAELLLSRASTEVAP